MATMSLYLPAIDFSMKHSRVEATVPSDVSPWTSPALYWTRPAIRAMHGNGDGGSTTVTAGIPRFCR